MSKFGISVAILMAVSGFFVARVPQATRPELAGVSSIFVILFAIPSYYALWRWLGRTRALQVLAALGAFAVGIEAFAIATGFPYGGFDYGDKIGAKVLGLVPWTVPFAWTPQVLGAFALNAHWPFERSRTFDLKRAIIGGTLVLLSFDLVLDPGAVQQKFWSYTHPGIYYGVPFSNFAGWLLSGAIGMAILWSLSREKLRETMPPRALMISVTWILCFWTSVCGWSALWLPCVIGAILLGILFRALNSKQKPIQNATETTASA